MRGGPPQWTTSRHCPHVIIRIDRRAMGRNPSFCHRRRESPVTHVKVGWAAHAGERWGPNGRMIHRSSG
jgi:hypothetical protein